MSGISFRYRKTGRAIDAGFSLYNGAAISLACNHWHVGDHVSVCFVDQREVVSAINEHAINITAASMGGDFLQIPCVVVERRHSVVWKAVGVFQHLIDSSVVLQAESGEWEDVLLWIVKGVKPEWVTEES